MRSLLSALLMGSALLAPAAEAGPAPDDLRPVRVFPGSPAEQSEAPDPGGVDRVLSTRLDAERPVLSRDDLLAQRAIAPEKEVRRPLGPGGEKGGRKNPVLAGFLSAAVPGAGQFYNGSSMGYLFLGVEAAAWIAHFSMHDTGMDKQTQFKSFADQHWSWDRYRDPAFEDCPPEGHSDFGVQDSTLQFLYDTRRNDWYEDIGKLSIYSCGWDSQRNRDIYRDMREDSNDFLRRARYATTAAFLNHLVSAVHAARGAARHNAHLSSRTEIDLHWSVEAAGPAARLTVSRYF